MPPKFAWYRLVDPNGDPPVSKKTVITNLAESVFEKNAAILTSIVPSQLRVYAIRGENGGLQRLLSEDCNIGDLGNTKDSALYVVVPEVKRRRTGGVEPMISETRPEWSGSENAVLKRLEKVESTIGLNLISKPDESLDYPLIASFDHPGA